MLQAAAQGDETGQGDTNMEELEEGQEPDFPLNELAKLDEMINRPRWVVPVLPKGELEVLLDASIDLCKRSEFFTTTHLLNLSTLERTWLADCTQSLF